MIGLTAAENTAEKQRERPFVGRDVGLLEGMSGSFCQI
jgi:hypothetical protein